MYTGLTGALKVGNRKVAYISGWSIEDTSEIIETTKVGQSHKEAFAGRQSWSASADGVIVFAVPVDGMNEFDSTGQAELFKAKYDGTPVELSLYLDVVSEKKTCFFGKGYIESLSVDSSSGQAAKISISIKGTGRLDLMANGKHVRDGVEMNPLGTLFRMKIADGELKVVPNIRSPYEFAMSDDGILTVSSGQLVPKCAACAEKEKEDIIE